MIVPIKWLQEYIDVPNDASLIAEKFTSIGYMLDRPIINDHDDFILDLEVRQNRSDCLSLIGLARDLGAVMHTPIKMPQLMDLSAIKSGSVAISIDNPELCFRFNTITIENLSNKPSPDWLKSRLEQYGIKSINALIDITNYVMVEFGQPLHAFDADAIRDSKIIVRSAHNGEPLTLLGDKKIELTSDDLIIADDNGPIAFAGIMGGNEKGIQDSTKSIILEAATYNQASIRRSTLRHNIRTEASTRLEKFLHPHSTEVALQRAAQLIQDIVGGDIVDHTDSYPSPTPEKRVTLNIKNIEKIGGIHIETTDMVDILKRLEIDTKSTNDDSLECVVPYFRTDIEGEADLIEEIIRINGYDKIPELPLTGEIPLDIQPTIYQCEETIRDIMTALGYDEQITEPLDNEEHPEKEPILLENSLTSEKTMLRTTLEHSLRRALNQRLKHRLTSDKIFEIGKIYFKSGSAYQEERHVGALVYHNHIIDVRTVKGDIEVLLERLGYLFSDDFVRIKLLGGNLIYFDINLDELLSQSKNFNEEVLSSPPQILTEDFSIHIPMKTHIGPLLQKIKSVDPRIYKVTLVGKPTERDGHINILITVSFLLSDEVLSSKDIEPLRKKILTVTENEV